MLKTDSGYIALLRNRYGTLLRSIRKHREIKNPALLKKAFTLMLDGVKDKADLTGNLIADSAISIALIAVNEI